MEIAKLPVKLREVVLLYYYQNMRIPAFSAQRTYGTAVVNKNWTRIFKNWSDEIQVLDDQSSNLVIRL